MMRFTVPNKSFPILRTVTRCFCQCMRWMVPLASFTVRICASLESFSLTTRLSSTMWSTFSSTCSLLMIMKVCVFPAWWCVVDSQLTHSFPFVGSHFVGYFSKEKFSSKRYNVSCIVTLPSFQRCGFGRFLIDFSYFLSRKEEIIGTPEKPLSELGKLSYLSYWKFRIFQYFDGLRKNTGSEATTDTCVQDISKATGINVNDIASTMQWADMLEKEEDG